MKLHVVFHDIHYLNGDNYEKHKEEVADTFKRKLSEYFSNNRPLKFIGYCLPEISFRNYEFSEPLYFNNVTVYGIANFGASKFSKEANFGAATFSGIANFGASKFSEPANFNSLLFYCIYFTAATFSKDARFNEATFSEPANFNSATFSEPANFNSATFSGIANFTDATFSGIAKFTDATFSEPAKFTDATFSGIANFGAAKFFELANFTDATFSEPARFREVTFSKEAYFNSAKFSEANFGIATFSGIANFGAAKFTLETDFIRSTFLNQAYFSGVFNGSTYFKYTIFEEPTKVIFDVTNMSNVSFALSDITKIRFSDMVTWGGDDKFTTIEEEWLKNKTEEISLNLVLSVYRNLRENYEFRLRYDEAGRFFIKEMELKRKYREAPLVSAVFRRKLIKLLKKLKLVNIDAAEPEIKYILKENGWWRRHFSLTGLYYHFSTYGESILKPTLIGVIIVGLSTLF